MYKCDDTPRHTDVGLLNELMKSTLTRDPLASKRPTDNPKGVLVLGSFLKCIVGGRVRLFVRHKKSALESNTSQLFQEQKKDNPHTILTFIQDAL